MFPEVEKKKTKVFLFPKQLVRYEPKVRKNHLKRIVAENLPNVMKKYQFSHVTNLKNPKKVLNTKRYIVQYFRIQLLKDKEKTWKAAREK